MNDGCADDGDCTSGVCSVTKTCAGKQLRISEAYYTEYSLSTILADRCSNGYKDAGETGIDCGGVCAPSKKCSVNGGCANDGDCTSGACSATGTCAGKRLRKLKHQMSSWTS